MIRLFDARHMGRRREPRIPRPAHGLRLITAQDMGANLDAKVRVQPPYIQRVCNSLATYNCQLCVNYVTALQLRR
jgi:hypothetical protein